ncbi:hypothetical protein D3C78_1165060 [compost metagenome]
MVDVAHVTAGEDLAVDDGDGALDAALVLGRAGLGRVDGEAVVPLALLVEPVRDRVVQVDLRHARLEVVRHDGPGHGTKELESASVAVDPGLGRLVEDEADKPEPGVCERHDEAPGLSPASRARFEQAACVSEVDLSLLAGGDLERDGGVGRDGTQVEANVLS